MDITTYLPRSVTSSSNTSHEPVSHKSANHGFAAIGVTSNANDAMRVTNNKNDKLFPHCIGSKSLSAQSQTSETRTISLPFVHRACLLVKFS